ncbi:hypothetical protein C7B82_04225 [Stenomitos frigidus ULC18]|uniref:Uncharacterized protein n=2 Tax=Stenomitos TaxID=1844270 RepID=A0A2T1ELS3_9CYAN|nr:hypothetical protein C7B82_04225 [Stenomitos frigidus ULC18]
MSRAQPFRKLPACDSCLYYGSESYLLCAVQPYGAQGEVCADFREDPSWQQFLQLAWFMGEDLTTDAHPGEGTQPPGTPAGTSEGAAV